MYGPGDVLVFHQQSGPHDWDGSKALCISFNPDADVVMVNPISGPMHGWWKRRYKDSPVAIWKRSMHLAEPKVIEGDDDEDCI